jgi:hypothetical protein
MGSGFQRRAAVGALAVLALPAIAVAQAGPEAAALAGARRGRVSDEIARAAPLGMRVQFTLRFVVN